MIRASTHASKEHRMSQQPFRFLATVLLASVMWSATALAGGGSFDGVDDEDADAGSPYVGDVKDNKGNVVPDAKITVTVKSYNSSLILRADDQGHFHVKGFDKSVKPEDVEIACSADGYQPFAMNREKTGAQDNAPIEITCVLEKK
jgi:hypothetical protein